MMAGAAAGPHPLAAAGALETWRKVGFVLCDMDDTLTWHGRLPARTYSALEDLESIGIKCIVVTGRPAGWCDMIARMMPVAAVVGENGAFYYAYRRDAGRMVKVYQLDDTQRRADRARLDALWLEALDRHPGLRTADDQAFRVSDLAIDIREDVAELPRATIEELITHFRAGGAVVKESSIHLNTWFW